MKKSLICFAVLWMLAIASGVSADEFRAFWADAWHSGYESPEATQKMVDYAKSCNTNAIFVEIRKMSDSYYTSSLEPTGVDVTPEPGYDSLADVIEKAHAAGLEVHAWVVAFRVWGERSGPPHTTPEHIWHTHPDWLMCNDKRFMFQRSTTSLDPGHPDVEEYLITVFSDIISRYDIDGFTLDYIRYPNNRWGYNKVALKRFKREYGRTQNPAPDDPLWEAWRRNQISNFVKRLYLESKAIKPKVKMGSAVWRSAESGQNNVLQDWDMWMANHWLDYAAPMNYTRSNESFHKNNADSLGRQYGHHVYISPGIYRNTISNSMRQIKDIQDLGFLGVCPYSYAETGRPSDPEGLKRALLKGPFAKPAAVPDMPWLTAPTKGYLKGFVRDVIDEPIYPATITLVGRDMSTNDSGTGFYGFSELEPGEYKVRAEAPGYLPAEGTVTISAGKVSDLNLTMHMQ